MAVAKCSTTTRPSPRKAIKDNIRAALLIKATTGKPLTDRPMAANRCLKETATHPSPPKVTKSNIKAVSPQRATIMMPSNDRPTASPCSTNNRTKGPINTATKLVTDKHTAEAARTSGHQSPSASRPVASPASPLISIRILRHKRARAVVAKSANHTKWGQTITPSNRETLTSKANGLHRQTMEVDMQNRRSTHRQSSSLSTATSRNTAVVRVA